MTAAEAYEQAVRDVLAAPPRAICRHCALPIRLYGGRIARLGWYHSANGSRWCPGQNLGDRVIREGAPAEGEIK